MGDGHCMFGDIQSPGIKSPIFGDDDHGISGDSGRRNSLGLRSIILDSPSLVVDFMAIIGTPPLER